MQITLTGVAFTDRIPAKIGRKTLQLCLTSAGPVTYAPTVNDPYGMPLATGSPISINDDRSNAEGIVYLTGAAGQTVNYTEWPA